MAEESTEKFEVLVFPENVRQRSGMWIGNTGSSTVLLKEVVDNALDEFQKGQANKVYIRQDSKKGHIVADNSSKGFSLDGVVLTDGHDLDQTVLDAAISHMSAGTKFNKSQAMAGMNGCGTKAVNALSDDFLVVSNLKIRPDYKPNFPKHLQGKWNGEGYYYVNYSKGRKKDEGFCNDLKKFGLHHLRGYSTIVKFIPDTTIMESAEAEIPQSLDYVMKYAELSGKKLTVEVNDQPYVSQFADYKYKFNVVIPGVKGSKNPQVQFLGNFELNEDILTNSALGSVNGTITPYGRHIELFKQEFRNAIKECFGQDANGYETNSLDCFVFLLANEVDYSSQAKTNLSRIPEFPLDNMYLLKNVIKKIIKANEEEFRNYYQKLVNLKMKKGDLNKVQKINNLLGQDIQNESSWVKRRAASYLPSKLIDAYSPNRSECELFVVEGNSASSDFQTYRDPKIHAVIPLRGVPLNSSHHDISAVLERSQELRDMVKGIGSGVDGNYNLNKLRYGKIVILADGDEDGKRISALILGFFASHCRYLLDAGKVYIGVAPFYIQDGKFYYTDEWDKLNHKKPFKRIKGLGSLGKYFKDGILNPATRKLIKVSPKGIENALSILTDPGRRKELLLKSGAYINEVYYGKEKDRNKNR